MALFIAFLVFVHLFSLAFGMGSGIAAARIGPFIGTADADSKAALFGLGKQLFKLANYGIALLWVSGILLVWLKFGGVGALPLWFWVKIVLVVLYSGTVGMGSASFRKFANGDVAASGRVALMGTLSAVLGVLIVASAVLAFH